MDLGRALLMCWGGGGGEIKRDRQTDRQTE